MRRAIIAGNWKMNMLQSEAEQLVKGLLDNVGDVTDTDIVVCPTYTSLAKVCDVIKGTNIKLGAQNVYWEKSGAYTGEISPLMLKDAGVEYVVIGHSERRQYFNDTNETVNKRAKACYRYGLTPIICVGETLEQRNENQTESVVKTQITESLAELEGENVARSIVAYEPVWAIGTGLTATPEQAQQVHQLIRGVLAEMFGEEVAQAVRIQYGGSVKPDNVDELMAMKDIDGALVGGAALKVDSFARLVKFSKPV